MVDIIFDAFSTVHALAFLCGAFFLLLIGAVLIGYWMNWRLKSVRVKGRIVAVRATGTRRTDEEWLEHYENSEAADKDDQKDFDEIRKEFTNDFKKNPVKTFFSGFIVMLFVLMPFGFFGTGAWFAYDYLSLRASGIKVPASVSSYETTYDSESGIMYYPVVSYSDGNGRGYNVKDRLGTGSKSYSVGENIEIYYDPENPQRFMIDSFWRYMGFALGFMGLSSLFIGAMFYALFVQLGDKDTKNRPVAERKKLARLKHRHYLNQHYIPVYEFKTRHGETIRIQGREDASNLLADKMPGRDVTLMVIPGEPYKVKRPGKMFLVFGLVCMLPGLLFAQLAFSQLSFDPGFFLAVLGILAYGAYKIFRNARPYEKKKNFENAATEMKKIIIETVSPGGYILTPHELRERVRIIDRAALWSVPFLVLFGIGMIIGGYYLFQDLNDLSGRAMVAQGEVVAINSRSGSDGHTYYPVVGFETLRGEDIRFEGKIGSNPPVHEAGDKVVVLYDPEKPERAIIDHGWMNWLPSIGLLVVGLLLFLYGMKLATDIAGRARRI